MKSDKYKRISTKEYLQDYICYSFSFGARLEFVREDYQLTKKAMAEAVGVSPSTWGTYENDSSFPAPKTIDKFCMLFHVNQDWLFANEGEIYTD